ncbi:MAG: exodeoxyribonuclease VII large subunit [Coriobacteriia bacterium]|nr:exodeoxyribonuclease VII large subunit [Coriobacteriia bacterium]
MGRVSSSYDQGFGVPAEQPAAYTWAPEPERPAEPEKKPFSVTGALGLARKALEDLTVCVVGEVSDVSIKAGFKAAYFTIKDEKSVLSCMMWNNRYQSCGVELDVGMKVVLTGRFTLYAARGTMNFDVFSIKLEGEGELRMQIARMIRKLEAEGLTAPERKRPIPQFPERIGLVTSPRGATVHDVLRTLRHRYPYGQVLFAGVPVEGPGAAAAMIEGLRCVERAGAEVILLIRGGGPLESLMPFNDESLARAIAGCSVPVVTGVGHETDTTVADLVADLRTLTPTFAAAAVSPDTSAVLGQLEQQRVQLHRGLSQRFEKMRLVLQRYAEKPVLKDVRSLLTPTVLELDDLQARLSQALPNRMQSDRAKLDLLQTRLSSALGHALDVPLRNHQDASRRLTSLAPRLLDGYRRQVGLSAAQLEALSPVAVLSRGYAIARDPQGDVLRSVDQVTPGQDITVRVADGTVAASVTGAEPLQKQ